jgi:hypothetical protein
MQFKKKKEGNQMSTKKTIFHYKVTRQLKMALKKLEGLVAEKKFIR